jgi:hypothetical protein
VTATCGHDIVVRESGASHAVTPAGETLCLDCANAREVARFNDPETTDAFAYLVESDGGYRVTTWPGATLATVERLAVHKRQTPSGGQYERWSVRLRDATGRRWYGFGPGPGMYLRLHLSKVRA